VILGFHGDEYGAQEVTENLMGGLTCSGASRDGEERRPGELRATVRFRRGCSR
jgi:hypothetical protein